MFLTNSQRGQIHIEWICPLREWMRKMEIHNWFYYQPLTVIAVGLLVCSQNLVVMQNHSKYKKCGHLGGTKDLSKICWLQSGWFCPHLSASSLLIYCLIYKQHFIAGIVLDSREIELHKESSLCSSAPRWQRKPIQYLKHNNRDNAFSSVDLRSNPCNYMKRTC